MKNLHTLEYKLQPIAYEDISLEIGKRTVKFNP